MLLLLFAAVAANQMQIDRIYPGYVPASLCYSVEVVHEHNRIMFDRMRLRVEHDGKLVRTCNAARLYCRERSGHYVGFDEETGQVKLSIPGRIDATFFLSPGWSTRKLGYGEKFYSAVSSQCFNATQ